MLSTRERDCSLHSEDVIMGVRINFSRGDNINALLILVMLLTMQCKCTFTKHLTFSTRLHHKDGASAYWLSHMKQ